MSNTVSNTNSPASRITIDGREFALDALSDNARSQIANLRVTDQEIAHLQVQLAIAQTARATYARALSLELDAATGKAAPKA